MARRQRSHRGPPSLAARPARTEEVSKVPAAGHRKMDRGPGACSTAEREGAVIKLKDVGSFVRSLERFGDRVERNAKRELLTPAETLLAEVRSQLSRPGSGRVYGRGRLGARRHQASAPGEPPAPDTRTLLESAHIEQEGETVRVLVNGADAAGLEFGTRRMQPRPYMRPALVAAKARMTSQLVAKLRTDKK